MNQQGKYGLCLSSGSFHVQCHAVWSFECSLSVSGVDVGGFARSW